MANLFVESCWSRNFWETAKITSDDIVFPIDGFSDQWLENLIDKNEIPAALITEYSFYKHPKFDIKHIGLPIWLDLEIEELKNFSLQDPTTITEVNFNFVIRKKRLTRFLLCKCVEMYKLKNYDYTLGSDNKNFDLAEVLDDIKSSQLLDNKQKNFILSEIKIPPKFIESNFDESNPARYNLQMWESAFQPIVSKSAISLITETIEDIQQVSMFTEKTLFSVLGFTFPIWAGSYAQADLWKEMGFDTFDDIIDHSYQYEQSILDRVVRSVKDNLPILQNLDLASLMRDCCKERLKKNKDLLLSGQVSTFIDQTIDKLPDIEKHACKIVRQVYRKKINGIHPL